MKELYWNEEREQFIKDFYGKPGYTGKSIAAKLGCSREAVIGKASRLGLTRIKALGRQRAPVNYCRPIGLEGTTLAKTSQNERMGGMGSYKLSSVCEILIDVPGYQCRAVPNIIALDRDQCRWPLDTGGFCGNDQYRGERHNETSYCLTHLRASVSPHHYRGSYWAVHK